MVQSVELVAHKPSDILYLWYVTFAQTFTAIYANVCMCNEPVFLNTCCNSEKSTKMLKNPIFLRCTRNAVPELMDFKPVLEVVKTLAKARKLVYTESIRKSAIFHRNMYKTFGKMCYFCMFFMIFRHKKQHDRKKSFFEIVFSKILVRIGSCAEVTRRRANALFSTTGRHYVIFTVFV